MEGAEMTNADSLYSQLQKSSLRDLTGARNLLIYDFEQDKFCKQQPESKPLFSIRVFADLNEDDGINFFFVIVED